ncbi:unnamed protein product [Soboliphyme baturini]|uniref:ANAPC4_WD40 domain-containing protein n=1 Tax=Soboliphyme baturini TaxID=241478 RepID=A0A183IAJ3_9BILA|nr:unnamed protein product [Soboliphyme baturini]
MAKAELAWSPHRVDEFLLIGEAMRLYRVTVWKESDLETPVFWKMSDSTGIELLNSVNVSFAKCFQWHPKSEYFYVVALGHANGRVLLTSPYGDDVTEGFNLLGYDFLPKHSRQCLCLAWNPSQAQLLAAGFDRYRSEYSVLIWDVFSRPACPPTDRRYQPNISAQWQYGGSDFTRIQSGMSDYGAFPASSQHSRALYEFGPSEAAHSLLWQDSNSRFAELSTVNKWLLVICSIFHLKATHC